MDKIVHKNTFVDTKICKFRQEFERKVFEWMTGFEKNLRFLQFPFILYLSLRATSDC